MKRLLASTVAIVTLGGVVLIAEQHRDEHGHKASGPAVRSEVRKSGANNAVAVHVAWGTHDLEVVRTYYEPRYRGRRLPPGLAKKYARTGQLPPGWQKKMEPLPVAVERRLPGLPSGHHRGVIEGMAVIYDSRGVVIDVAAVF